MLNVKQSNEKIYSHEYIIRKAPVMAFFLVQLQSWGLQFY